MKSSTQPNDIERAIKLQESDKFEEAKRIYQEILRIAPDTVQALYNLGVIYSSKDNHEMAIDCFNKITAIMPDHFPTLYNLGALYFETGNLKRSIECYETACKSESTSTDALFNLAISLKANGNLEKAMKCYLKVIDLNYEEADAHYNLGKIFTEQKLFGHAIDCFKKAIDIDHEYGAAIYNLAVMYHQEGATDEAINRYQKCLEMGHNTTVVQHMLAALTGKTTTSAPAQYIREIFDHYSADFEHDLINKLKYRTPKLLREALDSIIKGEQTFDNAIDLGCGTGLSGLECRDIVTNLTGVDISPKMIQAAAEKKLYDSLHTSEIVEFLQKDNTPYDLIIATDVFVYLGDLSPIFKGISTRTSNHAVLAFSTENFSGREFTLRPSGRYAHAGSYIKNIAAIHNFKIIFSKKTNLRKEKGEWIEGCIYILEKQTIS